MVHTTMAPKTAIVSAPVGPPNPECPSCSAYRDVLYVSKHDFDSLTLEWLVAQLKSLYQSDISIQVGQSRLIYDIDFDDYLQLKLSQVSGLNEGILVQDDSEGLQNIVLYLVVGDETRFPSITLKKKPVKEEVESDGDELAFELVEGGTPDNVSDASDVEIVEPLAKRQHQSQEH